MKIGEQILKMRRFGVYNTNSSYDNGVNTMNYITNYPFSTFLYISIVIITTLLSSIASRISKKNIQIIMVLFIVLILSLFSGFRGASVGTDTVRYFNHIFNWQNNIANKYPTEPGLRFLSKFSNLIVQGPQFTILVVAVITNALIVFRLWTLRSYISFSFAIFIYTTTYYAMTFSGIRQWIAVAIIFFGSKYIFKLKYVKFSIIVLIASLFHNTAILALILPILDMLSSKFKYKKQRLIFALLIFLSPLLLGGIIIIESKINLLNQYSGYFKNINWSNSTGIVIWVKLIIGLLLYLFFNKKKFYDPDFYVRIYNVYFCGLLISLPGFYILNLSRIGLYFTIFETIMFALIVKSKDKMRSLFFTIIIGTFSTLLFILELSGSGRGHVPYIPFWK